MRGWGAAISTDDPRHRNALCDASSVGAYLRDYAARLSTALAAVDDAMLDRACRAIEQAAVDGRRLFVIGNGGSAAIASHLCCDWTKGTHAAGHPAIDATSLACNTALYSAIANDHGFDAVFARQLDMVGRPGDVLIAISSSGESANILAALDVAQARGMTTIGLTGFAGGRLRTRADIALHVDVGNYGLVEDAHQAIAHVLAQFIACHRDRR